MICAGLCSETTFLIKNKGSHWTAACVNKWELRCVVNFFNTYRTGNYYYRRRPLEENIFSVSKLTIIKETWQSPLFTMRLLFNLCHKRHFGEKSHFKQAHFTPPPHSRSGTPGHIAVTICEQWNFLHVAEKENKQHLIDQATTWTVAIAILLNCCCESPYLCLNLSSLNSHVACTWPKSSTVTDKNLPIAFESGSKVKVF